MMIPEIIPNWHPVLVHFTVALFSISILLFLGGTVIQKETLRNQLAITARWNLWIGALITVGTVLAGLYAFQTVPHHREIQHLSMLDHRKWALGTAAFFTGLALWSFAANMCGKADFSGRRHYIFVALITVAGIMLAVTGYKGGELVYRHGIGVLAAMPENNTDNNGKDAPHDHHAH